MSELLDELPTAHLEYPLRNGVIGDWLVLGPLQAPLTDTTGALSKVARQLLLNSVFVDEDEVIPAPAERATSEVTVGDGVRLQGMWRVVNTREDGWIDGAQHVEVPHSFCAWAYAQVVLPARVETTLRLTTASPTQLWINGVAVYSFNDLPDQPTVMEFVAALDAGTNELLLRVASVGMGAVPIMLAVAIPGAEGAVKLPTLLEPVARRQKLATVMEQATLAQRVYSDKQRIVVRWPNDLHLVDALTARLQTPAGRIYGEASPMIQKGAKVDFGEAKQFPNGEYEVLLQPQFEEYYVQNMRVQRRLPLQVRNGKWSPFYYGLNADRRIEALEDAAQHAGTIWGEIARCALGQWDNLQHSVIEQALAQVAQRGAGYESVLLALLGWVARMGDLPDFPQEAAWELAERAPMIIEQLDAADSPVSPIWAACHLLAGQLYPQRNFGDLNSGEWHQSAAEQWLLAWLRATTQMGLPAGESEQTLADALLVLSHLVDLASADEVAEMAAVALDKLAFQIAQHSFAGAWGGSQDQVNPAWLVSARLGPLSSVTRLWWGQGVFSAMGDTASDATSAATVALACAESYTLPEIIAAVALDRQQENWLQRRDAISLADDPAATRWVNRSAFRTGDYLLAAHQGDFAAGAHGLLWRATLGPDAVIFGNQPASTSEDGAWAYTYWGGSAAAVRAAQWRDVLAVAYVPGDEPGLDFSHAYFPRAAFDEVIVGDGWAMARKGSGYVALTATGGVVPVTYGYTAQQELRAARAAIWWVQMGRAAQDGTFAEFVERVRAQPLTLSAKTLEATTLRGQHVRFAATVPLRRAWQVDGIAQPLVDFAHIAGIYGGAAALPADSVDIQFQENVMRLEFATREMPNSRSPSFT